MTNFRIDIQVIRGICLIAVFVYHFNKQYLNSGFIGVDIFFLLSGYVNTNSFVNKNELTFVKYHLHRITRLLPISWLVLLAAIFLTNKMNNIYQRKLYLDILSADLSFSNYRYIFISTDYLSLSEKGSIVLHYWSLSIEDQFYLLFPLIIRKLFSNLSLYSLFFVFSYIYSIIQCYYYHSYAYFSFISRIWQFLIGILLIKFTPFKQKKILSNILLIVVISILFLKHIESISPSFSIIPLILILLLLNNSDNGYILSSKILHHLGNISYCFYLFHYIIVYIFKEYSIKYNNIFVCFILTYILSYIFTTFYEIPIRNRVTKTIHQLTLFFAVHLSILGITGCLITINKNKLKNTKNKKLKFGFWVGIKDWSNLWDSHGKCPMENEVMAEIRGGNIALFLGDSHAEQWFNVTMPYLRKQNYIPVQVYLRDFNVLVEDFSNIKKVMKIFNNVSFIVIGHRIEQKIEEPRITYFKNYINLLFNYTNLIYIIQDTPRFLRHPFECINSKKNYDECYSIVDNNATEVYKFPYIKDKRIKYIDMVKYICKNERICPYVIDTYPVYKDRDHLSIQFATKLSKEFLEQFKVPKVEKNMNVEKNSSTTWYQCDHHNGIY